METSNKHRRFRFSLRTLLIAVGTGSVVLGVVTAVTRWQLRNYREHAGVIAISNLGGTYGSFSSLHHNRTGSGRSVLYNRLFDRVAVIDLSLDAWPRVERSKQGKSLASVSDDILPVLYAFADLKKLDLSGSGITDRSIKYLKQLRTLEELEIDGTLVSQAGCSELRQALPNCRIRR